MLPRTLEDYGLLEQHIATLDRDAQLHMARYLGQHDLYYLLRYILSTSQWLNPEDASKSFWEHPWLLDRCREVQFNSEGFLDIWARYHGKSTIKTFGFSILSMLNNPNITIGVFSVTKGVADTFVSQIKYELESNELLLALYPDKFYQRPSRDSQLWTVEKGFTIKRPLNLKDPTVKGFGLVDTSFTGSRISHAIYDDAVNEQNVSTPDMVEKTNERWELSLNVGMPGTKRYYIGTFYAHGDTYHHMASRGVKLRLYPCYEVIQSKSQYDHKTLLPIKLVHDEEKPVLFSGEHLASERKLMGPSTFGVQMLCDPNAGAVAGFKVEWLQRYYTGADDVRRHCNVIILVDPAASKDKDASYTAMWVIGLGDDGNYYILDAVIANLNLYQRTDELFRLVSQWHPIEVRYEKYSMQADTEHIRYVQEQRNFRFTIIEVGGSLRKDDRIQRLVPLFAQRKVFLPEHIWYVDPDSGEMTDIMERWVMEEYLVFPNAMKKDGLDAMSRIVDPDLVLPWPRPRDYKSTTDQYLKALRSPAHDEKEGWMSA